MTGYRQWRFAVKTAWSLVMLGGMTFAARAQPPAVGYELVGIFVTSERGFDTGIVVNNLSDEETIRATLTFFGENAPPPVTTPPILPGRQFTTLMSAFAQGFQGYVRVTHPGMSLISGGLFVADSAFFRMTFDVPMIDPQSFASSELRGGHSVSTRPYDTRIMLSNLSSDPVEVTLTFPGQSSPPTSFITTVPPQRSVVKLLSQLAPNYLGIVQLTHKGQPGDIVGHMAVAYSDFSGSAFSIPLADPAGARGTEQAAAWATNRLGRDTGIFVGNFSDETIPVTLTFYGENAPPPYTVPIAGGREFSALLSSFADDFQGFVRLTHAGSPGDIVAGLAVTDRLFGRIAYGVPMIDLAALKGRARHGPFLTNVAGFDSRITLDNLSDKPVQVTLRFFGAGTPPPLETTIPGGGQFTGLLSQIAPAFQGYTILTYAGEPGDVVGHIVAGDAMFSELAFSIPVLDFDSP